MKQVKSTSSEARRPELAAQVGGDHYKGAAIGPLEFCERNRLTMCQSSVVKYVYRHDKKGGVEDLRKARHILDFMIGLYYPEDV